MENGYGYSPFGETLKIGPEQGTASNTLQYTGRENDCTGLYYYRARYYDQMRKVLLSEDPIALAGGLNKTAIVGGNPISRKDPLGLCPMCVPIIIAACEALIPPAIIWVITNSVGKGAPPFSPDPNQPPTPDFEWRGPKDKGSWHNPETGESVRPDRNHPPPIGPHGDYKDPNGDWWRIFPDGTKTRK